MARGGLGDRHRIVAAVVAVVSILGLATGCGKPEFNYVTNSDDKTYFKVPSGWAQVDGSPVDEFFIPINPESEAARNLKRLRWSTAFDAASDPTADHMISRYPTSEPVVYSLVLHLPPTLQNVVSYDFLRDFFWPVTERARAQATQAGSPLTGFELINDEILPPSDGVRGVRVIYNYELPTMTVHTFDLTAYTNHDSSTVYFLLIRCTARCYRERAVELDGIATSFTVRSQA